MRLGRSIRSVAREIHRSHSTVQKWITRAGQTRLDRVDWSDRRSGPRGHPSNRVSSQTEESILRIRQELKQTSALGEYGDVAIRRELLERGDLDAPSVRTIARVLERRGALDGRRRTRRPPPPAGWYLPELADARAELDSFDVVEGLVIQGGIDVEVLNAISLYGALVASWPRSRITARQTVSALMEHWQQVGLPSYAQFDNDTRFQGAHQYPDSIGRVARLCLLLNVTVVFSPPRETGFQAAIESFNGRWQQKVWSRSHHDSLISLQEKSDRYVAACRLKLAARIDAAPQRRPFPNNWQPNLQAHPQGLLVFLRRTNEKGVAHLLGRRFPVDPLWQHRLVRSEVDLSNNLIRFYALRRHQHTLQPLLSSTPYSFPKKPFLE